MFHKYKYVLAVYKEQSFTRAAESLFISQPSLSAAIKNIENEVGAPLFERGISGVRPTEIGREYIRAAERMQSAENDFKRKVNDIYALDIGSITVGGTNYLSSYVLPKVIAAFSSLHPHIEVNLVEANSQALNDMLYNEQIDILLDSFDGIGEQHEGAPLIKERILLCVPASLPINEKFKDLRLRVENGRIEESKGGVPIEAFREESFILLKSGNDMHERAARIFSEGGVSPRVLFRVDQLNTSYALAASGMGLCFVTDTLVRYGGVREGVCFYKVGKEESGRTLHIAYKRGRYPTRAMRELIETAKRLIR